jgi:hypothetical protein
MLICELLAADVPQDQQREEQAGDEAEDVAHKSFTRAIYCFLRAARNAA